MGVHIGIDFSDSRITAYCFETGAMLSEPAVISRDKRQDVWRIGEDAYRAALAGTGVLTDHLISLFRKGGTSTVSRRAYRADDLMAMLFRQTLAGLIRDDDLSGIDCLVIALREADRALFDAVSGAALSCGVAAGRVLVISYQEAFIHYVCALDSEFSCNAVGLFDLSEDFLGFYSMQVLRGSGRLSAVADARNIEEKFRLGILEGGLGTELGDKLLTEAAARCLGSEVYSSVFLTGQGFERTDWAQGFLGLICRRRRVGYEAGLFAIGAATYASLMPRGPEYLCFCDTRIYASLSVRVSVRDSERRLVMLPAGEPWFSADAFCELIPAGQKYIDIEIEPAEAGRPLRTRRISLKSFPARPDRCTRVLVRMSPISARRILVRVTDLGFGDFYEAGGQYIDEYIKL